MNAMAPIAASLDALLARIAAADGADERAAAIDALNAEAFRRLIRHAQAVPGMAAALREAAADEVVYAVLRRHGILKASLHERAEAALASVRPMLASHGGDVELVSVRPPMVEVRLLGACDGCPASAMTLYAGVRKAIEAALPEITEVKQVKGLGSQAGSVSFTSPFAAAQHDDWADVAQLDELPVGSTRAINHAGHALLLSRFADALTCFENACAHMGLPMQADDAASGFITCPHHGFRYALETGECLTAPEVHLQAHAVRVVGDRVEIRLAR